VNSPIERVRLKGRLDRAESEIALLKEQLELIKNRFKSLRKNINYLSKISLIH
jgi:chaperonin cofactor prefoldin